jgi:hypothetical protein
LKLILILWIGILGISFWLSGCFGGGQVEKEARGSHGLKSDESEQTGVRVTLRPSQARVPIPPISSPNLLRKKALNPVFPRVLNFDSFDWSSLSPPLRPSDLYPLKILILDQVAARTFHPSLPDAMDLYWESCIPESRDELLFALLKQPNLSRASLGLPDWRIGSWLKRRELGTAQDLRLLKGFLKGFLKGRSTQRSALRDYLTEKYGQSFGSNYLFWRKYLEQKGLEEPLH